MIKEFINIVESMEGITDKWFDGGFVTYKHPTPIHYKTAIHPGTVDTLEGPVDYHAGHKIITGPKVRSIQLVQKSLKNIMTTTAMAQQHLRKFIR